MLLEGAVNKQCKKRKKSESLLAIAPKFPLLLALGV